MNGICRHITSKLLFAVTCYAALSFAPSALGGYYLVDLDGNEPIPLTFIVSWKSGAINESGQTVGFINIGSISSTTFRGVITKPNGQGMTRLGTLGGPASVATALNDSGLVVGWSAIGMANAAGHYPSHAFVTGANGKGMRDLGTLGGRESLAMGINNAGQVVGASLIAGPISAFHAFTTGPNGESMRDLGTLGGIDSQAEAINDVGQVIGASRTSTGDTHGFITGPNGEGMTDLGTLGGSFSHAFDIDNTGRVVGVAQTSTGDYHAFITGPGGEGMSDLGPLGGFEAYNVAYGINDAGQVVGSSPVLGGAFITGPDGHGVTALMPDGVSAWQATAINNAGQIIIEGERYLAPIPEPAAYLAMLAGLGLIRFWARMRRQ